LGKQQLEIRELFFAINLCRVKDTINRYLTKVSITSGLELKIKAIDLAKVIKNYCENKTG
jgi:hypothetical protein